MGIHEIRCSGAKTVARRAVRGIILSAMTTSTRRRLIRIIPWALAVWTVTILVFTLAPRDSVAGSAPFAVAKGAHVIAFGGWTFLLGLYLGVYRRRQQLHIVPLLLAGVVFGAIVELGQLLLPFGRSGTVLDVAINAAGVTAALLVLRWMQNRAAL